MNYVTRLFALLFAAVLIGSIVSPAEAQDAPFITVWDTENQGVTDDDQIKIPGTGTDYQIIWEEVGNTSNTDTLTATDVATVTFPNPGLYRVKISGDFTRVHFGGDDGGDADKIIQVEQWGDIQWSTMEEAFTRPDLFEGLPNLELAANDTPDLADVTSMGRMFEGASLTASSSNIGQWDVSSVTEMFFMFRKADSFNADLSEWDVSNVTNMNTMFDGASSFNSDLSSWDVSSVTDMRAMFNGAESFNADLSAWDVSSVTDMFRMFKGASSFNSDLGAWNVSNLTNASAMFDGSNLSVENYDRILIGWAWRDLQDDADLGADGVRYCDGGPFRTRMTDSFSWLIDDSGQQSSCPDNLGTFGASQVSSDGTFEFGDVGLAVTFSGLLGGDRITTARYNNAPRNVEGVPEENISQYRIIVAGGGISFFDSADLELAVNEFVGIDQPEDVTIYRRSQPGQGELNSLTTSVDDNGTPDDISDDTLSATITSSSGEDSFGEFVFASNTNPLATRLIGVAPKALDFGSIVVGDTTTRVVTISSDGEAVLEGSIGLKATESPYSIKNGEGEFSLEPGNELDVEVSYAPGEVSNLDRDTLQITHTGDSTDTPIQVPLEGTAEATPPVVQLSGAANVTVFSADLSGTVNPGGDTATVTFEYREAGAAAYEDTSAEESPLTGTTDQSVSATATDLSPDTEYEVRLLASNSVGADTSSQKTFSTEAIGVAITEGGSAGLDRTFEATPGESDQPIGTFRLAADTSGASMDSLSATAESSDNTSGVTQVALWASENNILETTSDTQLASRDLSGESGFPTEVSFGGFSDALSNQERYHFVTVSLSSDGQGTVTGFLPSETAVGVEGGQIEMVNGSAQTEFTSLPLSTGASTLPVEMVALEGELTQEGVRLTWQTASETNNAGFEVQRKKESEWNQIGYVESKAEGGTTTEAQSYQYTAEDLSVGTHQFRLKQVDLDGSSQVHGPISVDVQMQEALKLTAPAPNPVSSTATLSFAVKEQAEATVAVYDMLGRKATTLFEGTPTPGESTRLRLDASTLPSGAYLLRLRAAGRTETQRVTVLR